MLEIIKLTIAMQQIEGKKKQQQMPHRNDFMIV